MNMSSVPAKPVCRWGHTAEMNFVSLFLDMNIQKQFDEAQSNVDVFAKLQTAMLELGHAYSNAQLQNKVKNLKKKYRVDKDKLRQSGASPDVITFPYFHEFDAVYAERPATEPHFKLDLMVDEEEETQDTDTEKVEGEGENDKAQATQSLQPSVGPSAHEKAGEKDQVEGGKEVVAPALKKRKITHIKKSKKDKDDISAIMLAFNETEQKIGERESERQERERKEEIDREDKWKRYMLEREDRQRQEDRQFQMQMMQMMQQVTAQPQQQQHQHPQQQQQIPNTEPSSYATYYNMYMLEREDRQRQEDRQFQMQMMQMMQQVTAQPQQQQHQHPQQQQQIPNTEPSSYATYYNM